MGSLQRRPQSFGDSEFRNKREMETRHEGVELKEDGDGDLT